MQRSRERYKDRKGWGMYYASDCTFVDRTELRHAVELLTEAPPWADLQCMISRKEGNFPYWKKNKQDFKPMCSQPVQMRVCLPGAGLAHSLYMTYRSCSGFEGDTLLPLFICQIHICHSPG